MKKLKTNYLKPIARANKLLPIKMKPFNIKQGLLILLFILCVTVSYGQTAAPHEPEKTEAAKPEAPAPAAEVKREYKAGDVLIDAIGSKVTLIKPKKMRGAIVWKVKYEQNGYKSTIYATERQLNECKRAE